MNQDVIHIRGLILDTIIGILPEEKNTPQPIEIDIDLFADLSLAGKSDQLMNTICYADVVSKVKCFIASETVELVETLATNITEFILSNYPVEKVRLSLFKPQAIADAKTVGVSIERTRRTN